MYQNTLQLCGFRITANRKHRFTGKAEKKYQNPQALEKAEKNLAKALKNALKQ